MLDVAAPEFAPPPAPPRPNPGGLRVLVASYRSHPHVGGQGVYVREATKALLEQGARVDVISGPPYPDLAPGVGLIKLPSLDLFSVDNALAAFRPSFMTNWPDFSEWALHNSGAFGEMFAFGARLKRWLRAHAKTYDVLHDNQGLYAALLDAPRIGLPATATLHHPISVDLRFALDQAETWIDRALLKRWHGFVATQAKTARNLPALLTVSEASKAAAVADFDLDPARVRVAHNGVDTNVFRPDPSVDRDPDLIAATASSDTAIKGLVDLIDAFARIAPTRPRLKLAVIGRLRDGPAQRKLAAAGLGERVTFTSGVPSAHIADLYRRAGLVIAPSRFEGFGFPAAEAMACGACVLATDGGALPEVVGDAGVIAPAGDPAAVAAAALALLDAPARRAALGAAAARRARTAFSWAAHARAALDLYADIGARAHRRT